MLDRRLRPILVAGLAGLAAACGRGDRAVDLPAVDEALEGMASRDLWPGFDPTAIPMAIYDGERTYLLRHPDPPEGFEPVGGGARARAYPGRHPAVRANTSAELGGARTATVLVDPDEPPTTEGLAALLVHEAFHIHQEERYPGWTPNEVELFTYPVRDARNLHLRRLETAALRRAVEAPDSVHRVCWARSVVRLRRQRFQRLPQGAAAYERGTELREGLARHVEARASSKRRPPALPAGGFAPEDVRERGYAVGHAFAHLLDRLRPGWEEALAGDSAASLSSLLEAAAPLAVRPRVRCGITPDESRRTSTVARADLLRLGERDAALRREFEERPGWRLVVAAAGAPLFPAAFDPLNVRVLDGHVLHTRWLRLQNDLAVVEVLDGEALTEAAGSHPLFEGVRTLVVTGLPSAPAVQRAGDTVEVRAGPVEGTFVGASVERGEGKTLRILLAPG